LKALAVWIKFTANSIHCAGDRVLSGARNLYGIQSLGALLQLKLHRFSFIQGTVAIRLDGGKMHKHIFASRPLNETVTFSSVKPLDDALFFQSEVSLLVVVVAIGACGHLSKSRVTAFQAHK